MKDKRERFREYGSRALPYLIFAVLLVAVIACKENYFVDEIYSYGLANHVLEDGSTICMQPKLAPYTYSGGGTPYYDYMTVQPGERFAIGNVWHNQAADTHPPFYYLLLHVVCSFFPAHFTKWQAGMINIFFALLTLVGVQKLSKELGCSERERKAVTIFFIVSAGMLGAIAYLRMYIMAMCEVTWFTWLILKWRNRECRHFYVLVTAFSVIGVLTHYYFIIYLFFISLFYGMSLLAKRAYAAAFRYCGSMICAGGIASLLFPAMWRHIFGGQGRGGESFRHLHDGFERYCSYLGEILGNINVVWFGNTLIIVGLVLLLYVSIQRGGGKAMAGRFLEMAYSRWYGRMLSPFAGKNSNICIRPLLYLRICGYSGSDDDRNKEIAWNHFC